MKRLVMAFLLFQVLTGCATFLQQGAGSSEGTPRLKPVEQEDYLVLLRSGDYHVAKEDKEAAISFEISPMSPDNRFYGFWVRVGNDDPQDIMLVDPASFRFMIKKGGNDWLSIRASEPEEFVNKYYSGKDVLLWDFLFGSPGAYAAQSVEFAKVQSDMKRLMLKPTHIMPKEAAQGLVFFERPTVQALGEYKLEMTISSDLRRDTYEILFEDE